MLGLALLLATQHPDAVRAESLLASGRAYEAARAAERAVRAHPEDPALRMLAGRAHFARPVVGRYPALRAFRAAARLAPLDPEPRYWQTEVGLALASDEGEGVARGALLELLAIHPDYRDTWRRFLHLFGNAGIWRRADAALARHGTMPVALQRRAQLALFLDQPARAESLLAVAAALGIRDVEGWLLRAEAAFLAGSRAQGGAWVDSAVAHAADDSTEALWGRFWLIASADERAAYAATAIDDRSRFFTAFLARRDPDLTTFENERLAEHFARLAQARRQFRLLHPLNLYHRSAFARAVAHVNARTLLQDLTVYEPTLFRASPTTRARAAAGLGLSDPGGTGLEGAETSATTSFALAGLDARGLLWVRHGPPARLVLGTFDALRPAADGEQALDVESWVYDTPEGPVSVGFRRQSGGLFGFGSAAGDFLFAPVSERQLRATRSLLRSDRTAIPAPLATPAWVAFFRDSVPGRTAAYVGTRSGRAAAVLWTIDGAAGRATGERVLRLSVRPGVYDIGVDVDSAGSLGRVRGTVAVPSLDAPQLVLSSLLLAAGDAFRPRDAMLAAMPPDLTFAAESPLVAYAELHGLSADSAGIVRYRVRYALTPRGRSLARLFAGARPLVLEFEREAPGAETVIEQLAIAPGRLSPGRHQVSLSVTDLQQNVKTEAATVEVVVR